MAKTSQEGLSCDLTGLPRASSAARWRRTFQHDLRHVDALGKHEVFRELARRSRRAVPACLPETARRLASIN